MFWLKKTITAVLLPVPLASIVIVVGLVAMRWWPRLGKSLILLGPAYLLLLSCSWVSSSLAHSLESRFPVWQPEQQVHFVLVLGSGHHWHEQRTAAQQLSATALARLTEGLRVLQHYPNAQLVLSGYGGNQSVPHAVVMRAAAIEMGIEPGRIITLPEARDTGEEARMTAERVGESTAVLVTSATHMVRAFSTYQKQGIDVIAAPTDFIDHRGWPWYFSAANLLTSQRALHEYLGMLWNQLNS